MHAKLSQRRSPNLLKDFVILKTSNKAYPIVFWIITHLDEGSESVVFIKNPLDSTAHKGRHARICCTQDRTASSLAFLVLGKMVLQKALDVTCCSPAEPFSPAFYGKRFCLFPPGLSRSSTVVCSANHSASHRQLYIIMYEKNSGTQPCINKSTYFFNKKYFSLAHTRGGFCS